MFPTSLEHPYVPRGRRRGRNDPNSRDYICPCGKSYLSYPALFTHIKIKHNGRAPGQIIKPKTESLSKRGRPRQKQVYDSQSDTNDIAANCIDRLCDFVTDFEKPEQRLSRGLKEMYMRDGFYNVYVNFNPQQQQPRYNQREDLYEQYCDNVFCEVIAQVNKRINEPYHIDLITVFFMLMAHFINESSSIENVVEQRNEGEYEYGQYGQNEDLNGQHQQEYVEQQNEEEEQIVEEQYGEQQNLKQQQKPVNSNEQINYQSQEQKQKVQNQNQNQEEINNYEQNQVIDQIHNQIIPENQESFSKLKEEPIRNIVNYVNNFVLAYNKIQIDNHLTEYKFFHESHIKQFIQLFFHWLTMKKYIGYKVKVNQNFN